MAKFWVQLLMIHFQQQQQQQQPYYKQLRMDKLSNPLKKTSQPAPKAVGLDWTNDVQNPNNLAIGSRRNKNNTIHYVYSKKCFTESKTIINFWQCSNYTTSDWIQHPGQNHFRMMTMHSFHWEILKPMAIRIPRNECKTDPWGICYSFK